MLITTMTLTKLIVGQITVEFRIELYAKQGWVNVGTDVT